MAQNQSKAGDSIFLYNIGRPQNSFLTEVQPTKQMILTIPTWADPSFLMNLLINTLKFNMWNKYNNVSLNYEMVSMNVGIFLVNLSLVSPPLKKL